MIEEIAKLPRAILGCWPTPLMDAKHLSKVLDGPRILIKRDDLSGLALGGNKVRLLEFLMAGAMQKGFDAFVVYGSGAAGNVSIQLACAAAKLGVKVRQIMFKDLTPREKQGNYVLHKILDSDMRPREPYLPPGAVDDLTRDDVIANMNSAMESEVSKLREEGYNPFLMRLVESYGPLAVVGWINAVDEILQQLKAQNIEARYLVVANGGGITQAGLTLGAKYLRAPFKVIGIATFYKRARSISGVVSISNEAAEFLELGISIMPDEVTVYGEYLGEGHRKMTEGCKEAIRLVAQTEGFFLDPVYSGKAMAGLVDLIRKGRFTSKDTVVFIHTGGIPTLFSYYEELTT